MDALSSGINKLYVSSTLSLGMQIGLVRPLLGHVTFKKHVNAAELIILDR